MFEVAGGGVAIVVGHGRDRQGEVALYEYGGPPPLRPCVVSSGVRSESWRADVVELGYSGAGRVL